MTNSGYIEYKDLSDLWFSLRFTFGKQNVLIYVWNTDAGLKRNTYFESDDYAGAYVFFPGRKNVGLFGEIHLLRDMIGSGYVAHEIQHFIYDWLGVNNGKEVNEESAQLSQAITSQFWTRYWKESEK